MQKSYYKTIKTSQLFFLIRKNFGVDPYYILGVKKSDSYESIKKHYYKLASEYHPDKNPSQDAAKLFITIKEAFESIKYMKGHSVKIDSFHKHSEKEFKSVRPDSYQYKENFKEENNEKMDYKEYSHRTPAGPEYKKFKDSFDEMHNINNIKFSTEHVELPNPSKRFDIEPRQLLKKKFTDSVSLKFILYLSMGGLWLVLGLNILVENARKSFHDNVFYNLLNKNEFKDYVQSDEKKIEDISSNIKSKKEYKIYEEKMKSVEKEEEFKRDRVLPKFMPFININKLQENQ